MTQGNKIVLPRSVYDLLMSRGIGFKQFQILNPSHRELKLFFHGGSSAASPSSQRWPG